MGALSSIIDLLELFTDSDYSKSPNQKRLRTSPATVFSSEQGAAALAKHVKIFLNEGKKADAITYTQQRTGWDLQAATNFVENLNRNKAVTTIPHQSKHSHTVRSRQTEIDAILQQQQQNEQGGGGLSIYDYLINLFRKK